MNAAPDIQNELPSVTVIIPAHNEAEFIERCIASVRATGWPSERLDILVVDNNSTDNTAALADRAGARVVQQSTGRIGAIRNAGLKAARGDLVAYVDGDCTVAATWLRDAVELFRSNNRIGAVGGPCLSPVEGTWVEKALAAYRVPRRAANETASLATSSFIAPRALLQEAGYFDETLSSGEDDDMSQRIRRKGLVLISAPECYVVHYGYPRTWWALLRKQIWHGSNQLETSAGLDPTLILTHMFLLGWLAIPPLLAMAAIYAGSVARMALVAALLAGVLPPLSYAFKKLRAYARDSAQPLQWTAIGFAYFGGRSLGLVQNYWRRLKHSAA